MFKTKIMTNNMMIRKDRLSRMNKDRKPKITVDRKFIIAIHSLLIIKIGNRPNINMCRKLKKYHKMSSKKSAKNLSL